MREQNAGVRNPVIHWKNGSREVRILDLHNAGTCLELELSAAEERR